MRRLRAYVHVHHSGRTSVFGPNDEVPDWAAELISNPKAWADESAEVETTPAPETAPVVVEDQESGSDDEVPPRGGPGSSRTAWESFAETHQVAVTRDMNKAEIIAACEAAGIA